MANERARQLRNGATAAERRLWYRLRELKPVGHKFRRQVTIDRYIVDFACLSKRLIVEVDGATHGTEAEIEYDHSRQRHLEKEGFIVLRVTNADVADNIEGVMEMIVDAVARCRTPTPDPSPQGGGG